VFHPNVGGTVRGSGPFVRETHHESLLRQAFIGIVAMVALPLSTSPRSGARPKRR